MDWLTLAEVAGVLLGATLRWVIVPAWLQRDARRRGAPAEAWVLAWLLFGGAALAVWLWKRPPGLGGNPASSVLGASAVVVGAPAAPLSRRRTRR
jgi:hypothetical protein